MNCYTDLFAKCIHLITNFFEIFLQIRNIHDHHHVEVTVDDGLRDVEHVDVVLGQVKISSL